MHSRTAHVVTGDISIFHARRVILDMCLFTIIHEKVAGIRDAQFHAQKSNQSIMKQNSPRIVVCMDGTRGFGPPWSVIDWWRESKNFTILFGNRL